MNIALARAAKHAISDPDFVSIAGRCKKFVRQVDESIDGDKYGSVLEGPSALTSARAFLDSPWGFLASQLPAHGGLQIGDIVFKTFGSGGFGHVGIFVGDNRIAENSSTHIGRVQGAKGYRTLDQFGHFDVVGRLPAPQSIWPRLIVVTHHPGGDIFTALDNARYREHNKGFDVDLVELARVLRGQTRSKPELDGTASFRVALASMGYGISKDGDHMGDKNDPRLYAWVQRLAKS